MTPEDEHLSMVSRYPYGVLTEQEGGVANDAYDWESATHVCRKHRIPEWVCQDVEMPSNKEWSEGLIEAIQNGDQDAYVESLLAGTVPVKEVLSLAAEWDERADHWGPGATATLMRQNADDLRTLARGRS